MDHKGWHSRGYLPHFGSPETVQFVTFRLADSLPRAVAGAIAARDDNLAATDRELDRGRGACWLREAPVARVVEEALLHFDGDRYRLLSWCLMPNHVHAVVVPFDDHGIGQIVHSWKSFSAKQANAILGRSGSFWHRDYFDRFIRDEAHLFRTIAYVESNPVKAGLAETAAVWPWSSARFRR